MTFDALAMHAIRDEIEVNAVGGRVDAVYLIDHRRVGIEFYAAHARRTLVFSLDPADSRIYFSSGRVGRGTDAITPFLLLLRKYIRGSRLIGIEQPRLERVFALNFSSRPDEGLPREISLVAEAMGRRSNLILLDEDSTILDCLERLPPAVNPARPLLPHLRYSPPPAEMKPDPTDPNLGETLQQAAATFSGTAWSFLVRTVAGVSPLLAREALYRALGDHKVTTAAVTDWGPVANRLLEITEPLMTGRWTPCIALDHDEPIAFAAYQLTQYPEVRLYPSVSEVLEAAGGRSVRGQRFERLKQPLQQAIQNRADQLRRKRSSLERALASADSAEDLRNSGEIILANATQIQPGATALEWEGQRIDLYPTLSPSENAQGYFHRYTAARDARKVVPPLLEEAEREIAYLDEMSLHVTLADEERDISALRRELEETNVLRAKGKNAPPKKPGTPKKPGKGRATAGKAISQAKGPYREVTEGEARFLVGTSALGNDWVTFHLAAADDLWFHVRGAPSAHVILRSPGGDPKRESIEAGARIAAGRSGLREERRVEVDVTARRFVRRIPNGSPGQVSYRNETTLVVTPALPTPD